MFSRRHLNADVEWSIPYDTTPFVQISVNEVIVTLLEAMALVVLVMFLFLQNWRATLIPALIVPVALAGACLGLYLFGFSINVLSLFAMVLSIGILVDDAIVVVENVERIMSEEGLGPSPHEQGEDRSRRDHRHHLVMVEVSCDGVLPRSTGGI